MGHFGLGTAGAAAKALHKKPAEKRKGER